MIRILIFFLKVNLFSHSSKMNINTKINKNFETYNYINHYNKTEKKNIILGTIVRYSLKTVSTFFNSLIHSNFTNCDVVIFIKKIRPTLINYLKDIGVILVPISKKYNNIDITKLRWKLYFDYLEERKNTYNQVFTTDIRDVVFQKDIFKYYDKYKSFLGLAIEDNFLNQTTNKLWIVNYVGEEIYREIQNERVICFGTIWGSIDKILELSSIIWEKVRFNKNSTDQGIGNYLFYYEKFLNDYLIKSDNFGPVMTIGATKKSDIHLDSNDNILTFKGEIASVIHQYYGKKNITKKICKKYLYNKYQRDSIINFVISSQFLILFLFSKKKILLNIKKLKLKK